MAEQDERIAMMETVNDNYDSPWKEAVEHYFPEFISFYFPEAYTQIDWSKDKRACISGSGTTGSGAGCGTREALCR